MRSSYWQPWRCTPRRHTGWVSRQYVPLSRTSPKTFRTDSVVSIMNPLQTYSYRLMLFNLPSLVSIHEWWCLSSNVGACADQKQHYKQKTLEVENGRLNNVNYTWCLEWGLICCMFCWMPDIESLTILTRKTTFKQQRTCGGWIGMIFDKCTDYFIFILSLFLKCLLFNLFILFV